MNKIKEYFKDDTAEKILALLGNICLIVGILYAVYVCFFMNTVGRSLWLDEMSLYWNIMKRGFRTLTSEPLELMQSSPIIYIYTVKIFERLFGNSEFVLRLPSFIFYLGLLGGIIFSIKTMKLKWSFLGCFLTASLSILMRYSCELKQYMCEAFLVMLLFAVYTYYLSQERKNAKIWYAFGILGIVAIWGGNPCCFILGGILIVEFVDAIILKDNRRIIEVFITGLLVIFNFGLYYLYWLKPVIDAGGMTNYWQGNKFPLLFFTSKEKYSEAMNLVSTYLVHFKDAKWLVLLLSIVSVIIGFMKKRKEIMAISSTLLLTLFASSLGLFPVQDRIGLFFYPLLILLYIYLVNIISDSIKKESYVIIIGLSVFIFLQSQGMTTYSNKDRVMLQGEEVNGLIEYVCNNYNEDKLYLYDGTGRIFAYKLNMDWQEVGQNSDKIIWGKNMSFQYNSNNQDIEDILNNPEIFLMISHVSIPRTNKLFNELTKNGYVYLVKRDYGTPLYYYSENIKNEKVGANIEFVDTYEKNGENVVMIRVHNTGEYYLGNAYNPLYIGTDDDRVKTVISGEIGSGETRDIEVSLKRIESDEEIELNLYLEDQYKFDSLGTKSIQIKNIDGVWCVVE